MRNAIFIILLSLMMVCQVQAADTQQIRLSDFYQGDSILRMEGSVVEVDMSVPLAGSQTVTYAELDLRSVSSIALIKQRSVLSIRFNNATIGQFALDPNMPNMRPKVAIPPELWRAGYNTLTFAVSQHYANQCVDNNAPELWTEIDLYRSVLTVESEQKQDSLALADLAGVFNAGIGRQQNVSVFAMDKADKRVLSNAIPLVAQALALRTDYQNLGFHFDTLTGNATLPPRDDSTVWTDEDARRYAASSYYFDEPKQSVHVLVGTATALRSVLSEETFNNIKGAYLGIERTPEIKVGDKVLVPARDRLLVSGTNAAEVERAAMTLGMMDDGLNPSRNIIIDGVESASNALPLSADILLPGSSYSIADMGATGAEYRGEKAVSKRIAFNLPADFYVPENATFHLFLDFAYGAEFGPGSMMNVLINGELVHGLPLTNPNGESFRKYQLNVPGRHLKGGRNYIDVDLSMRAPITDVECDDVMGKHLHFQLLDTSRIELPEAGHVARQPDLKLFAETAYPLATDKLQQSADIYLTSTQMMDAALTLSGKLAQTARTMLPNIHVQQGVPATTTTSAIILATPASMPSGYNGAFQASLDSTKKWPYRLQNLLHNRLREAAEDKQHQGLLLHGVTVQQSDLGKLGVMVAKQNPQGEGTGTVFMIATETPELMRARVMDLISPSIWGQLAGDFVAWDNAQQPALMMQVADVYVVGEFEDSWLEARMWLSNHPWYWLIAFIVVVLLCSLLAYVLLRKRNDKIQEQW